MFIDINPATANASHNEPSLPSIALCANIVEPNITLGVNATGILCEGFAVNNKTNVL
jgi:hypothetical protein